MGRMGDTEQNERTCLAIVVRPLFFSPKKKGGRGKMKFDKRAFLWDAKVASTKPLFDYILLPPDSSHGVLHRDP